MVVVWFVTMPNSVKQFTCQHLNPFKIKEVRLLCAIVSRQNVSLLGDSRPMCPRPGRPDVRRLFSGEPPPNPIRHERKTDCAITRGMCAEMSHIGPKTTPRVRRIFPGESCDPPGKEATSLARGKAVCDGKRPLRRCRRAGRFWKSELARDLRQAVQHGGTLGGRKPRKEFFA